MSDSLQTPWTAARQAPLSSTISWSLLKFMRLSIGDNYLTVSSSANPFSFCLRSFPALGSFPMSWLFKSGGQSNGASVWVLLLNIQGWFPLGLTGLTFLQSTELSRVFSSTTVWNHQFFRTHPSLWSNSHICTWVLEKPQPWLYRSLLKSDVSAF